MPSTDQPRGRRSTSEVRPARSSGVRARWLMRAHRRQTIWVWAGPGPDESETAGGRGRGRRAGERRRTGRAPRIRRRVAIDMWNPLRVFDGAETADGSVGPTSEARAGPVRSSQSLASNGRGRSATGTTVLRNDRDRSTGGVPVELRCAPRRSPVERRNDGFRSEHDTPHRARRNLPLHGG